MKNMSLFKNNGQVNIFPTLWAKLRKINRFLLLLFMCLIYAIPAAADNENKLRRRDFDIGGAFSFYSEEKNWTAGPEISITFFKKSRRAGLYMSLFYPAASKNRHFYSIDHAFTFDLGYCFIPGKNPPWLRIGAGASMIFGGDSNGDPTNCFGLHLSSRLSWPISKKTYLWVKGILRFLETAENIDSKYNSGLAAGIGFQF